VKQDQAAQRASDAADDAVRGATIAKNEAERASSARKEIDDTPGCTKEASGFRDAYDEFEERGAVVLGVSPDDQASHARFKEKYALPFTLLADPEHEVAEAYGAWREKKNYGKTYWGVHRSTFVIGPDGTIACAMYGVKPDGHPEQVLAALPA
jgi:peroxiredoxin Q/BCP